MNKTLLFATNNSHKLREIREIIGDSVRILSLEDVGFENEIPETGETLAENASQKARYIYERTGTDCFADDTGLFIDALGGRPGIFSARYAGERCSFEDNIRKVLKELEGIEERKASFRCVICLILEGNEYHFDGQVDGIILTTKQGTEGFGYDPVFQPNGQSQTFSQMPPYLKNGISHRGRAIGKMLRFLGT